MWTARLLGHYGKSNTAHGSSWVLAKRDATADFLRTAYGRSLAIPCNIPEDQVCLWSNCCRNSPELWKSSTLFWVWEVHRSLYLPGVFTKEKAQLSRNTCIWGLRKGGQGNDILIDWVHDFQIVVRQNVTLGLIVWMRYCVYVFCKHLWSCFVALYWIDCMKFLTYNKWHGLTSHTCASVCCSYVFLRHTVQQWQRRNR